MMKREQTTYAFTQNEVKAVLMDYIMARDKATLSYDGESFLITLTADEGVSAVEGQSTEPSVPVTQLKALLDSLNWRKVGPDQLRALIAEAEVSRLRAEVERARTIPARLRNQSSTWAEARMSAADLAQEILDGDEAEPTDD